MKRGEIYFDAQYTYPAGNTVDKFLIVLNKLFLPNLPIIAIPTTTNKENKKYNPGCNHRSSIFYLHAKEDFFEKNTIVEIYILSVGGVIPYSTFVEKQKAKAIEYSATLREDTIARLIKCIKDKKQDITEDLHQYLF